MACQESKVQLARRLAAQARVRAHSLRLEATLQARAATAIQRLVRGRKTRAQMKMRERRELRQRDEAAPSLIDEAVPVDVS